jgi:hypothetical protein
MKGGRKLSKWNLFVKKVYHEGKTKNSNYGFKEALKDASRRKSEMGSMKTAKHHKSKRGSTQKRRKH